MIFSFKSGLVTYIVTASDKGFIFPSLYSFNLSLTQFLHNPAGSSIFETNSFFSLLKHLPQSGFPQFEQQYFALAPQLEQTDSNRRINLTNNYHYYLAILKLLKPHKSYNEFLG